MNPTLWVALATLLILASVCAWLKLRKRTEIRNMANSANAPNCGRHTTGRITMKADAAITRWNVVKIGSDAYHVAVSAGATDISFGIAEDQALAAEDLISVAMIPGCVGTTICIATGVIVQGALVQSNGDGTVKTAVSTGYVLGRALTGSGATGDQIEVAICFSGVALA